MKEFSIFVLDDDHVFCSLLLCLVERRLFIHSIDGYKLDLTVYSDMKNLDGAVKYIENNKPDLILLDYYLGVAGCTASLEVLEKIIICCVRCTDIKIITGMHPEDVRFMLADEAAGEMGIDIIQKPFSIAEFVAVIEGSIRKKENAEYC